MIWLTEVSSPEIGKLLSLDVSLYVPSIDSPDREEVFDYNITHNLGRMADEAGVYDACWRPDEHGWTHARDIIPELTLGLAQLVTDPDRFSEFNPTNNWGSYQGLVRFVEAYLEACQKYPDAEIHVSR